jgi:hypothetical protein
VCRDVQLAVVETQESGFEREMTGFEQLIGFVETHYGITPSPRSSARACAP